MSLVHLFPPSLPFSHPPSLPPYLPGGGQELLRGGLRSVPSAVDGGGGDRDDARRPSEFCGHEPEGRGESKGAVQRKDGAY